MLTLVILRIVTTTLLICLIMFGSRILAHAVHPSRDICSRDFDCHVSGDLSQGAPGRAGMPKGAPPKPAPGVSNPS